MNRVLVTVFSTQTEGTEALSQEYRRMPGQYYEKGGARYLVYEEPEGEPGQTTRVVLCLKEDFVQISRKGVSRTQITLVPGRETTGIFETPFGNIPLRVRTQSLTVSEEAEVNLPDGGAAWLLKIDSEYTLTMRMTEGQETDVTSRITVLVEDGGAEG